MSELINVWFYKKYYLKIIFKCSKLEGTLRAPLASISLLFHQVVFVAFIGVEKIKIGLCENILTKFNGKYPKVSFWGQLFLKCSLNDLSSKNTN